MSVKYINNLMYLLRCLFPLSTFELLNYNLRVQKQAYASQVKSATQLFYWILNCHSMIPSAQRIFTFILNVTRKF